MRSKVKLSILHLVYSCKTDMHTSVFTAFSKTSDGSILARECTGEYPRLGRGSQR
jgi:hypothetical protein